MSKMLAVFIVIWGMLLALHAAPTVKYPSFIVLRVLLGCAESVVTPCFTIITAQYWKTEEQFTRVSIWFGMNGLGSILINAIGTVFTFTRILMLLKAGEPYLSLLV